MKVVLVAFAAAGCASNGGNWMTADFNKHGKNYRTIETSKIVIGESKAELIDAIGANFTVVEARQGYEVIAYQKWKSAMGPDYVEATVYVGLEDGKVKQWKVTNDVVVVVPASW